MMGQPADQCRCHPLVVKNIHPLGEFQVRIQDDRQVKSVVGYRAAVREPAPEKKKQAKSAVRYREAGRDLSPEKKKQVESVVRHREVGREPDFLKDLLQWSPELPAHIRKPVKTETQK